LRIPERPVLREAEFGLKFPQVILVGLVNQYVPKVNFSACPALLVSNAIVSLPANHPL
jgi:hypothetical protein